MPVLDVFGQNTGICSDLKCEHRSYILTPFPVCERIIDDNKGTLQSPNFPNSYPENTYCTYRFGYKELQPGYHYVINFTAFDLEPAVNGSCVNDYVEVSF